MKFKNTQNEKIESTDGRTFWISRSVAVVGVITAFLKKNYTTKGYYVLGVKRGQKVDNSGKYCLPCGYLDWDETAEDGAKREVWEETGLDIDSLSKGNGLFVFDSPWKIVTDPALDAKQNISLYYGAVLDVEELPALTSENCEEGEVEKLEWIPIEEFTNNREWAFNHATRVEDFKEYLKSNLFA
jgi:8-oxo-dGTP pyrophosphatase MutT (NUDIX family)